MSPLDQKEGNYWQLPDGEKQNRCPRRFIKEDPEYWQEAISAYNAYEKGFLPSEGGTDRQPNLFMSTMNVISTALKEEDDFEKDEQDRIRAIADRSKGFGSKPGHASLAPPKRK